MAPISTIRRSTALPLLSKLRFQRRDARPRRGFFYGSEFNDATIDRVAASITDPSLATLRSTATSLTAPISTMNARPFCGFFYGSDLDDATLERVAASSMVPISTTRHRHAASFTAPISTTRRSTASRLLLRLRFRRRQAQPRCGFFYGSSFKDATLDRAAASFTAPISTTLDRSTASLRLRFPRRDPQPRRDPRPRRGFFYDQHLTAATLRLRVDALLLACGSACFGSATSSGRSPARMRQRLLQLYGFSEALLLACGTMSTSLTFYQVPASSNEDLPHNQCSVTIKMRTSLTISAPALSA